MDETLYARFLTETKAGLRAQAKATIRDFADSFTDLAEKAGWTRGFLSTLCPGERIRHELYEAIVFPVLLSGYERKDAWSLCWLGNTWQNLSKAEHLYRRIDFQLPTELFKEAYSLDPSSEVVREGLLRDLVRGFNFMGHEWPSGILYDPNKPWPNAYWEAKQEIRLARELDTSGLYARDIGDFEENRCGLHSKKALIFSHGNDHFGRFSDIRTLDRDVRRCAP